MTFAENDIQKVGLMPTAGALGATSVQRSREQFERISQFLGQSQSILLLEPIASLIILAVLWGQYSGRQASLWVVLVWIGAILRGLLSLLIARAEGSDERLQEWSLATGVATGLAGAIWASGLLLMWPFGSGFHAVFLVTAIVVVVAVLTASVARYLPATIIYLALTFSVGLFCVIPGQRAELSLVFSIAAVLAAGLFLLARHLNRFYANETRLHIELDAAYEAATAAQKAKSEFVANMSHELRTPLNAINGFSEIIKDQAFGPLGDEKYLNYAQDINDSGTRLLEVLNDILEMSKLETGEMILEEDVLDIDAVVRSAFNRVKDSAEKAGVNLSVVDSPDRPKKIIVDQRLLKQILSNLLSNAIKFTPLGGEVSVEAKYSANRDFLLLVRDNGIGMEAEEIPIALAQFGQADASLSRRFEGTGLGLPLVKALIQLHGGEFRLESESSVGTTAIVTFPASCIHS